MIELGTTEVFKIAEAAQAKLEAVQLGMALLDRLALIVPVDMYCADDDTPEPFGAITVSEHTDVHTEIGHKEEASVQSVEQPVMLRRPKRAALASKKPRPKKELTRQEVRFIELNYDVAGIEDSLRFPNPEKLPDINTAKDGEFARLACQTFLNSLRVDGSSKSSPDIRIKQPELTPEQEVVYRYINERIMAINDAETEELSVRFKAETKVTPKNNGPIGVNDENDSWEFLGNCLGVDTDLFFPERGASTREAKEVCRGCTVQEGCLEFALGNGEKFGIWGGMSERERRRIRRRRRLEHIQTQK